MNARYRSHMYILYRIIIYPLSEIWVCVFCYFSGPINWFWLKSRVGYMLASWLLLFIFFLSKRKYNSSKFNYTHNSPCTIYIVVQMAIRCKTKAKAKKHMFGYFEQYIIVGITAIDGGVPIWCVIVITWILFYYTHNIIWFHRTLLLFGYEDHSTISWRMYYRF